MNRRLSTVLVAGCLLLFSGCAKVVAPQPQEPAQPSFPLLQFEQPSEEAPVAVMQTSLGEMAFVLYPEQAPLAVENFTSLAKQGYYDGNLFFFVEPDIMIQSGDPDNTGSGGQSIWGEAFEDEFSPQLHHFTGALVMANSGPDTNKSQFAVVTGTTVPEDVLAQMQKIGTAQAVLEKYEAYGGMPWNDTENTVFGQLISGSEVASAIAALPLDAAGRPTEEVAIDKITITTYQNWLSSSLPSSSSQ